MRRGVILIVAIAVAIGMSITAAMISIFPGDQALTLRFQDSQAQWIDSWMRGASQLGSTVGLVALSVAAALLLIARSHRAHVLAFPIVSLSAVLVPLLKETIDRPRPSGEVVEVLSSVKGYSFPSGHAFLAITIFGLLYYMADRLCGPHRHIIWLLRSFLIFVILSIGASRVYLGVHWTSDVLGGYLLGGISLFISIQVFETWARSRNTTKPNALA